MKFILCTLFSLNLLAFYSVQPVNPNKNQQVIKEDISGYKDNSTARTQDETIKSEDSELRPLAIYEGEKLIAEIGMSKEDVEKNLGVGQKTSLSLDGYIYDNLSIGYRNDKVCAIYLSNPKYTDSNNITIGMNFDDIENKINVRKDKNGEITVGYDENKKKILENSNNDAVYDIWYRNAQNNESIVCEIFIYDRDYIMLGY